MLEFSYKILEVIILKILVETSARHIHLSEADFLKLFGEDYIIKKKKDLSQPGQFVCEERVTIEGPRGQIERVSILGPFRDKTQVEISLTDSRKLGVVLYIRESGNLKGSSGCKIIGPAGEIILNEGVIIAKRHIHLDLQTAKSFDLKNNQNVKVKIETKDRSLIFDDVIVRVSENYSPIFHIDTDESNAAGIEGQIFGEIL